MTVLSLQEGSEGEKYVKQYLKEQEWFGRLVIVSEKDNQHFDAMAASDYGFIYDGQMVSSANVLHLPTSCLIKMRMHHQWWHNFYNRWWNDMNIVADNSLNDELIGGQVWFGKICDTLAQSYLKPGLRFEMIKKCDGFIQEAIPLKPLDRTVVEGRDLILEDGLSYTQHYDPMILTAKKIISDMDENLESNSVSATSSLNIQIQGI